jgi:hypothetical protein
MPVHYSPRTPLTLVVGSPTAARARLGYEVDNAVANGKRVGVLLLEEDRQLLPPGVHVESVGSWSKPAATATRLFSALRSLDASNLDQLFARQVADPSVGLGRALADRLRRAARLVIEA